MMKEKGALLLLPNLLGEHPHHEMFLPISVDRAVATLDGLIAESEKEGRRYLSRFKTKKPAREVPIAVFNKNTSEADLDFFLEPIEQGERWGYVSDAGLPCIADPGSLLVKRARQKGLTVQAFVGPSSIFLALMLSGIPAQKFTFHGYLNKTSELRRKQVQKMEESEGAQVFIEAPHRNQQTLEDLIQTLGENTVLCVAVDLTLPTQKVLSYPVKHWRKISPPNIDKKPTTFIFISHTAR